MGEGPSRPAARPGTGAGVSDGQQSGVGSGREIVRLEVGLRVSYLFHIINEEKRYDEAHDLKSSPGADPGRASGQNRRDGRPSGGKPGRFHPGCLPLAARDFEGTSPRSSVRRWLSPKARGPRLGQGNRPTPIQDAATGSVVDATG